MNATFDRSFTAVIKNETTFVVNTITNVQNLLNRNSIPAEQKSLIPSIELPFVIHICCCCFLVVVVLLTIVRIKYVARRQQVTKRKHLKNIFANARPFDDIIVMNPPDESAQPNQIF